MNIIKQSCEIKHKILYGYTVRLPTKFFIHFIQNNTSYEKKKIKNKMKRYMNNLQSITMFQTLLILIFLCILK